MHDRILRGDEPAPAAPARTEPVPVVAWPVPLAAALERHALVGRARELDLLEACWGEAVTGTSQLVLLAGDAGIGKTRLAAELGRRARDDGALVLYGRFDEEALAPYQPVVEMVRGWSSGASLEPLRERIGVRAAELGILFGEFGPPPADDAGPASRGNDGRRPPPALLRRRRGAARRDRRAGAARARVRRPALGRPPDAPAAQAPRAGAAAAAARCCSAPTATPRSRPGIRCTSWSATSGARGC